MIELPEAKVLSDQMNEELIGKEVVDVIVGQSPHKFAWLSGDTDYYKSILQGKKFEKVTTQASFVEVILDGARLLFSEGIQIQFVPKGKTVPKKHQLLLSFDDGASLTCSVQMYGGMWCYVGEPDYEYYQIAKSKPTPFEEEFTYEYFLSVIGTKELTNKSAKEVLATKQRIPGLGNGVLQDILFEAGIHPKRKMSTLSEDEIRKLYIAVIETLKKMTDAGGRDSEKDIYGAFGGYMTKVGKKTVDTNCKICNSIIMKDTYMGGSIYFCPCCQPED